jgi:hypothetical protein
MQKKTPKSPGGDEPAAAAVNGDLLVDQYSPLFDEDAPEHASPQARQVLEAQPDPRRLFDPGLNESVDALPGSRKPNERGQAEELAFIEALTRANPDLTLAGVLAQDLGELVREPISSGRASTRAGRRATADAAAPCGELRQHPPLRAISSDSCVRAAPRSRTVREFPKLVHSAA